MYISAVGVKGMVTLFLLCSTVMYSTHDIHALCWQEMVYNFRPLPETLQQGFGCNLLATLPHQKKATEVVKQERQRVPRNYFV